MEKHPADDLLATVEAEIANIQAAHADNHNPAVAQALNNIKAAVDGLVEHAKANKKGKQSESEPRPSSRTSP